MKIQGINISAISTVLPNKKVYVESLNGEFNIIDIMKIAKATGILEFRIAENNVTSSDICYKAALNLFEKFEIKKSDIDGLIFVSQTNDYLLPQTSNILQSRIGLSDKTFCLDIRLGCSGYVFGLIQAAILINSKICNNVLVLAGDTTSKLINKQDKSLRLLFGDAGSATLVSRGTNTFIFDFMNDGSGYKDLIVPAGGFRYPISSTSSVLKKDIDNNYRTDNNLYMDGSKIFNFAINRVPEQITSIIKKYNINEEDLSHIFFHQANEFMIKYLIKKLKIDKEKVPICVKKYGNTGPASIPLTISNTINNKISNILMCGFGVGLSMATLITDISGTKILKTINYE